ncbi:MAG: SMC-Scp complex subunit ScpB [Candidatus Micrarchaeia archaeon]
MEVESNATASTSNTSEIKRRVEAVLFMSTEPVHMKTLAKVVGMGSYQDIKTCAEDLKNEYNARGSSIEIVSENDSYFMRLRDEYLSTVAHINKHVELSKGELKTLAYIAKKEGSTGVLQSTVVRVLGQNAYQHIQKLVEMRFVNTRPSKRSKLLSTTQKFREYFRVENI